MESRCQSGPTLAVGVPLATATPERNGVERTLTIEESGPAFNTPTSTSPLAIWKTR
jgi:hypothetical protein